MKLPNLPANFQWLPESPPQKRARSGSANGSPSSKKTKPNPTEKRARSASVNASPSPKKARVNSPRTAALRKVLQKRNLFPNHVGARYALTKPVVSWSTTTTSVDSTINLAFLTKFITLHGKYAVVEITGYKSAGGKAVYRETQSHPPIGDISNVTLLKLNMVFLYPDQTASILVFKSGKIIIHSSGPWERVARILAREYLPGKFRIMIDKAGKSNYVSKFSCNRKINTEAIFARIDYNPKQTSSFRTADAADANFLAKDPNKSKEHWFDENADPFAKPPAAIPLPNKAFKKTKISVSTKYLPKVTLNIFTNGTVVAFSSDPNNGPRAFKELAREVDNMFQGGNAMTAPVAKMNAAQKAQAATERRYKLAPSWNATKNGFYVRPGSNGKPRFYELKDVKLQKTKTIRAYLNAKVPIPANVKTKFSITNANMTAPPKKPAKPQVKKEQLLNTAYEMNLAHVSGKMKKANIKKVIASQQKVNVVVNGVNHTFQSNGSILRASRTRKFDTLKASDQNAIAQAYMTSTLYEAYKKAPRKDKFKFILNVKHTS